MAFNAFTSLPDLNSKVVIVTGANRGIGYAVAKHLYYHNATVYLCARDEAKATEAIDRIKSQAEKDAYLKKAGKALGSIQEGRLAFLHLDLADPKSVKETAEQFMKTEERLDVLINNAAFSMAPYEIVQGFDVQKVFLVNYISTFVFTLALMPVLKKTAVQPGSDVRVVITGSDAYRQYASDPNIKFKEISDFNQEFKDQWFSSLHRYGLSKLALVLFNSVLQKRLVAQDLNILCLCIHPGVVNTFADRIPFLIRPLFSLLAKSVDEGGFNSCFAAFSPLPREKYEEFKGKYLTPVGKIAGLSKNALREGLGDDLWTTTVAYLEQIGVQVSVD